MAKTAGSEGLGPWLRTMQDERRKQRVLALGLLTGLKSEQGRFHLANFERGLVLDRLVETRRPQHVLEVGTGRGLGCLSVAAAAEAYRLPTQVTTIDSQSPAVKQAWPVELKGDRVVLQASRDEVWGDHVEPSLVARVRQLTGRSSEALPRLLAEGARFDLVFIDAGHDLHSVVHDLAYATQLLTPDGAILMDDYAPMEDFGVGTCIAVAQARHLFRQVEVFPTEGLVYGNAADPAAPRGMAFLAEPLPGLRFRPWKLRAWRVAASVLHRCYQPGYFPVTVKP